MSDKCQWCKQEAKILYRLPDSGVMKWLCWACYPPELRDELLKAAQ